MSLNTEDNHDLTLGDFYTPILVCILSISLIWSVGLLAMMLGYIFLNIDIPNFLRFEPFNIHTVFYPICIGVSIIIILCGIGWGFEKIGKIKIYKCKR